MNGIAGKTWNVGACNYVLVGLMNEVSNVWVLQGIFFVKNRSTTYVETLNRLRLFELKDGTLTCNYTEKIWWQPLM